MNVVKIKQPEIFIANTNNNNNKSLQMAKLGTLFRQLEV